MKSNNIEDYYKKGPYFEEAIDLLSTIQAGKRTITLMEEEKEKQTRHEKEMLRLLQRSQK
jgi:hypothetical protein